MQWVLLFLRIFVACCFVFTVFQMNQDRELAPDRNSFDTVGFLLQIRVFVAVVCVFVPTFPRFISGGFPIVPDSFPIVPDLFPTVPDLFRTVPDLFPTKDNLCCFFTDSLDSKQGFFQNHSSFQRNLSFRHTLSGIRTSHPARSELSCARQKCLHPSPARRWSQNFSAH